MSKRMKMGERCKDSITGFTGIVVARTEWLYGCMRVMLQPEKLHDGKPIEAQTFDEPQLEVVLEKAVKGDPKSNRHGGRADVGRRPDMM